MAKRCPTCRAPMKQELVFHRKIGTDNRPQLYHYVRRDTCPEGCTVRLDFSKAKPLRPGMRPMVLPTLERLRKTPDFNDKLLAVGMGAALLLFVVGVLLTPTSFPMKGGTIAALVVMAGVVYIYANQRVVLPESFPRPLPEPEPEVVLEPQKETGPGQIAKVGSAAKKKGAPVATIEIPTEIPKLERKEGEPIKMSVVLEGEQYELSNLDDGENMLDAALDRDVEIDYSCREGMCDSCLVRILAGVENISEPTPEEVDMLGEDVNQGLRLSCQVKVFGPVKIMQE